MPVYREVTIMGKGAESALQILALTVQECRESLPCYNLRDGPCADLPDCDGDCGECRYVNSQGLSLARPEEVSENAPQGIERPDSDAPYVN